MEIILYFIGLFIAFSIAFVIEAIINGNNEKNTDTYFLMAILSLFSWFTILIIIIASIFIFLNKKLSKLRDWLYKKYG